MKIIYLVLFVGMLVTGTVNAETKEHKDFTLACPVLKAEDFREETPKHPITGVVKAWNFTLNKGSDEEGHLAIFVNVPETVRLSWWHIRQAEIGEFKFNLIKGVQKETPDSTIKLIDVQPKGVETGYGYLKCKYAFTFEGFTEEDNKLSAEYLSYYIKKEYPVKDCKTDKKETGFNCILEEK